MMKHPRPSAILLVLALLTPARAQQSPVPRPPATQPDTTDTVVRVYDLRDLAVDLKDFDTPPAMKVDEWGFPAGSNKPPIPDNPTTKADSKREKLLAKLKSDIEHIVAFDSWKDNGGSTGAIRELPGTGQFIITQTPENHELIRAVLDSWREERAVQVAVESRFIGRAGDLAEKPPFPGKWVEENGVRRWSEFLDDDQTAKLIAAAQQNQDATTLTSPRLTMFNHQRAYVVVATPTAYVASVTARKLDNGFTKFDPTIKSIPSGVVEDVRVTVSDDRHSVKLELHTRLNSLRSLESVASPDSDPAAPEYYQLPHVVSVILDSTLDVPDGKTVLFQLTPQTNTASTSAPAVNVQGSPPFVRALTSDGPTLVIVKPTVILQR